MLQKNMGWRGAVLITGVLGIACALGFSALTRTSYNLRERLPSPSWSPALLVLLAIQGITIVVLYLQVSFLLPYVRTAREIDFRVGGWIQPVASIAGVVVGLVVALAGRRNANWSGLKVFRRCALAAAVLIPLGVGLSLSGSPMQAVVAVGLSCLGTSVMILGLYTGVLCTTARRFLGLTLGLFSCVSSAVWVSVSESQVGQLALDMGPLALFVCLGVLIAGLALLTRMTDGDGKVLEAA
jgi:MFS family permease